MTALINMDERMSTQVQVQGFRHTAITCWSTHGRNLIIEECTLLQL